eukprot:TRINITY_DN1293_c0_g2_i1.p1 TRINITY_DN1293_c0_g2~~TRINITY_DN1293_c0_g2_i1.p1  ORF type:complete len:577 (+),score=216.60 TRINITY_DN1293_c0_g2_i1:88-1731(+)
MGCGGSAQKQEPSKEKYKEDKPKESKPEKAASPKDKSLDLSKTKETKGGGQKSPRSPRGSPRDGDLSPPMSPRPQPETVIHSENRLECKFGDVELEHRLGLWQIIRGQDTISRPPPPIKDIKAQCRVSIRTDFGGDINLILTPEEAEKLRKSKELEKINKHGSMRKKKKKNQDAKSPTSPEQQSDLLDTRELLVCRAAKDRELMGLQLKTLRGHPKGVKVCMLSPNDWLLVTSDAAAAGTDCNPARCTDIRTGLQVGILDGRKKRCFDPIAGAAFSTDGQQLATIHKTDQMLLWDMNTFRVKKEVTITDDEDTEMRLVGVAVSPDMKLVACAAAQFNDDGEGVGRVPVHDNNAKPVSMFRNHQAPVSAVAFSPDSCNVLSGSDDGAVMLWVARTAEPLRTFEGHPAAIKAVTFNPDAKTLYTLDEQCLSAWTVETGVVRWTKAIDEDHPVQGKTAVELKGDYGGAASPRAPTGASPRTRLKFTTVCLAANNTGFLGMVDRRVTVFNADTGAEVDQVTTKAPVTAMSAGCRAIGLGDMWGNIYLVHIA